MADLPYRIVIGLEVHVQLLTRTKLFCGCSTQFGLPPNSATCPVCLGLPGVLPVMNRRAFELALRAALALNCEIASFTKWDRKNYYYPDLPKNYQISQYDLPFSHDGWLEIATADGTKKVGIIRAHLEEDAGKNLHDESGRGVDLQPAVVAEGEVVLADLVVLGQVGVVVVLAVPLGEGADLAVEGQGGAQGQVEGPAVHDGQHARHADTHGAGRRVGRQAELRAAPAK